MHGPQALIERRGSALALGQHGRRTGDRAFKSLDTPMPHTRHAVSGRVTRRTRNLAKDGCVRREYPRVLEAFPVADHRSAARQPRCTRKNDTGGVLASVMARPEHGRRSPSCACIRRVGHPCRERIVPSLAVSNGVVCRLSETRPGTNIFAEANQGRVRWVVPRRRILPVKQ